MENLKIIFDTDCLCSFFWVKEEKLLLDLFEGKMYIPEAVENEIKRLKNTKNGKFVYENFRKFIDDGKIEVLDILFDSEESKLLEKIKDEYYQKYGTVIGEGESHMLALAISLKAVYIINTASNNLKDILEYIKKYDINNITTMDILCMAYDKNLKSFSELEEMKQEMLMRKRHLPEISVSDYYRKKFSLK